jgi:hypothetical protein
MLDKMQEVSDLCQTVRHQKMTCVTCFKIKIYMLYINSLRLSVTELGSVTNRRPGPAWQKQDSDESANLT